MNGSCRMVATQKKPTAHFTDTHKIVCGSKYVNRGRGERSRGVYIVFTISFLHLMRASRDHFPRLTAKSLLHLLSPLLSFEEYYLKLHNVGNKNGVDLRKALKARYRYAYLPLLQGSILTTEASN
jgi:hypothetical protein